MAVVYDCSVGSGLGLGAAASETMAVAPHTPIPAPSPALAASAAAVGGLDPLVVFSVSHEDFIYDVALSDSSDVLAVGK